MIRTRVSFRVSAALLGAMAALVSAPRALAQDGGAQDAGASDGGVPLGTVSVDGGVTATTTGDAAAPWAGTVDVPLPAFLDTTDRRIRDDRPPPSAEQVAALREMEAEVGRFTKTGTSYREAIRSILRREYTQRRREREQGYARQIREEERLQNEARERAIRLFERFVRRYPDDPTYTPDAMFRLGELYYERSAIAFQDAALAGQTPESGHPDYMPTISLYRELVRRFPNYRRIDGVYYLIGYCLNEMGEMAEARLAWLNLVCANRYHYTGESLPTPDTTGEGDAGTASPLGPEAHPALTLDPTPQSGADEPFIDPYADCQPVTEGAEFVSETWLRIGEYHFDFDYEPHALERAISAYRKVLADPEDRNYNLALYKVAWAYYRGSRYPEAIEHFVQLIDWSDREYERTGRAGSELRAEAVQYLGITFAYDDWNEDQIPDPDEGQPTGFQRIQNPELMPQDRPWTVEIYFQLGQIYFEEDRYDEAIEVWEYAIRRWPLHHRVPEIVNQIARAHERRGRMREAQEERFQLADYGQGSEWWEANLDHPIEQRRAEQLAEASIINAAIQHHQQAQRMRRLALENQDERMLQEAIAEYNVAAQGYQQYIEQYPNSPNAYELQYNLADALFWSQQYEQAAAQYAAVRDSNLDDRYLSESARRVVLSLQYMLEDAQRRGEIEVRDEPPAVDPGPPPRVRPVEMPQLVQRVAQAREIYLARVPAAQDREGVRAAYDYNNTLLLYNYGWWEQARERFRRIYLERCRGPQASEEGQVAWISLRNIAVQLGDTEEVERLARDLQQRQCTFSPDASAPSAVDCNDPANQDNPQCLVTRDLGNIRFQRALELYQRARGDLPQEQLCPEAPTAEQVQLFEQSATDMVNAVNDDPRHADAPRALIQAAVALECTSRYESASRVYQRVVDEVGPVRAQEPEQQQRLDSILATAYFRLAYTANRFFDYERAIESYRVLADSPRFASSTDPGIQETRTDALINAARILEYQQDYNRAADYYRRAAEAQGTPPDVARSARFRVAEMAFKRRDWNGTIREMRAFIDRYRGDAAAGELLVTAYWRIAQARQELRQTRDYRTALQDVVDAFSRAGQERGSIAAEYAAQARFTIVDENMAAFETFAINPGSPATLEAYVNSVARQIEEGSARANTLVTGYAPVLDYGRPTWTIAAFVRQGRVYEVLARAVLNTPFVMPADLQRRVRGASADVREEVRVQVQDRIQQTLDQRVRPIECFAIARYALAARAARAGSIDNEYTRLAADRLQAYGDERIAECIAAEQQRDPSFAAYTPGEFARARAGRTLPMTTDIAAPPLAREEE
ncbi:tetratricopeptide repeat protein [Sandaracinus amylolyticus]|uniref:TPR domain protein, putative component of TonB system n=1 Tax=Sandaracinus amylolyticus TaxID=927083 RepID=A0A0F6YJS4_9BACT|nr:tetratricopeptide repeat protein [Sandaracinus amylolyticus]AKF06441.1 TPR domain protein, putative component of TonB system [Sandaracinus amylolyticus]